MTIITENNNFRSRVNQIFSFPHALSLEEHIKRDFRPLEVGMINLMAEGAIKHAETDFFGKMHLASGPMPIHPHFIRVDGHDYGRENDYMRKHSKSFDQMMDEGVDMLIIPGGAEHEKEFLKRVIEYAKDHVTCVMLSCGSGMAFYELKYGLKKNPIVDSQGEPMKLSGMYEHEIVDRSHPLVSGMNTHFDVIHSRYNDISLNQYLDCDQRVLAWSPEAGVHLATSEDGIKFITMQGHPEYQRQTLLLEWIRDLGINRRMSELGKDLPENERVPFTVPPLPVHYFNQKTKKIVEQFAKDAANGMYDHYDPITGKLGVKMPKQMRDYIMQNTRDNFSSAANKVFANALMLTQILTHVDRHKPLMDQYDPENPLNLPPRKALSSPVHVWGGATDNPELVPPIQENDLS